MIYLVFSQRAETEVDEAECRAHAARFFGATLTANAEDRTMAVTLAGQPPALRAVAVRRITDADLALAIQADANAGGAGLGLLARRCLSVLEVSRHAPFDAPALRLAALLASVVLGPIVDTEGSAGPQIFGVKTAREKLAHAGSSK